MSEPYKILFLCTGNSARSILCEYLIRHIAPGRFISYSAGTNPAGSINPHVRKILTENYKIDCSDARSKSWKEFENADLDFIITVCDNARETCPVWPGHPITAHWRSDDPSTFVGTEEEKFQKMMEVALQIQRRLELFTSLPFEQMERLRMSKEVEEIGAEKKAALV